MEFKNAGKSKKRKLLCILYVCKNGRRTLLANIVLSVQERCQVFTWIDELGESHSLIRPPEEIKRRLMEMLLHNCSSDICGTVGQGVAPQTENAVKLIRLVQGFLTEPDVPVERFSNRVSLQVSKSGILLRWSIMFQLICISFMQ